MSSSPDRTRAPGPGASRPVPIPVFDRRELGSGLVLACAPRRTVPLVEIELLLSAGGERSPSDRPGLAQLTAALLDEGSLRRSGPELSAALERRGGALATSCDWNAASIRLSLPSSELQLGFDLLAELLFEPSFPSSELERLRRQSLAELARRVDQPGVLADEELARGLYPGTVYAEPLLGTGRSLGTISREEIVEFHRENYALRSARLVVAGDFDPEAAAALAESTLAPRVRASPNGDVRVEASDSPTIRSVIVDRPGAAQTELRIGQVGIPRRHPDRTAMGFLNSLFGGKFTSRVNLNLRERLGITYGAFSRLTDRRSAGPFTVACAVSNQAVGLAATEILRELDRLRTEPVDPSELEETRSYLLGVLPYGLQTIEGLASRLRDIALFDLPLDQMERTIVEYRSLDAEQLLELARRQVHPERSLIVAAGPASELAAQLEPLGPLRVVTPDGRKGGE